jgi:prevent-host-death family protein
MTEMASRRPGEDCSAFIDRAVRERERVRVTRDGKDVAAVIPIEDLELLERFEDHLDLLEALEALDEAVEQGGVIAWEQFEAELGLS